MELYPMLPAKLITAAGRRARSFPQPLRPLRSGRQMAPAHEPAIVGDRGMVHQVVVDDPVELLVGVVGRDTLGEPVPVVVGVLRRLRFRIELDGAAGHLTAVAERGPTVPVEA